MSTHKLLQQTFFRYIYNHATGCWSEHEWECRLDTCLNISQLSHPATYMYWNTFHTCHVYWNTTMCSETPPEAKYLITLIMSAKDNIATIHNSDVHGLCWLDYPHIITCNVWLEFQVNHISYGSLMFLNISLCLAKLYLYTSLRVLSSTWRIGPS